MLNENTRNDLLKIPAAFIADAMLRLQLPERTPGSGIRPVARNMKIVGTAVTVRFRNIPFEPEKQRLERYGKLLSDPGDVFAPVIVIQVPKSLSAKGIFGGGAASMASSAGYVGAVIEGSTRDTVELEEISFPVFSRGIAPGNIVRYVEEEAVGETVTIGETEVNSGDIIVADDDGVMLIERKDLSEVVEKARAVLDWEEKVYSQVRTGVSRSEAVSRVGPRP